MNTEIFVWMAFGFAMGWIAMGLCMLKEAKKTARRAQKLDAVSDYLDRELRLLEARFKGQDMAREMSKDLHLKLIKSAVVKAP